MILPIGVGTKRNRGFTLIEILLVVVIIGIILAIAAPNFSKGYSKFQLNKTSDDLLSLSRWAQAMAIGQDRSYALVFSYDRRSYGLERAESNEESDDPDTFKPLNGPLGRMHPLPDTIHLDTPVDNIEFHPDGTIDEAIIELHSPEQKAELSTKQVRGMMSKVNND